MAFPGQLKLGTVWKYSSCCACQNIGVTYPDDQEKWSAHVFGDRKCGKLSLPSLYHCTKMEKNYKIQRFLGIIQDGIYLERVYNWVRKIDFQKHLDLCLHLLCFPVLLLFLIYSRCHCVLPGHLCWCFTHLPVCVKETGNILPLEFFKLLKSYEEILLFFAFRSSNLPSSLFLFVGTVEDHCGGYQVHSQIRASRGARGELSDEQPALDPSQ